MIRIATLLLLSSPVHADVLICGFTPTDCAPGVLCEPYEVTINTHHGAEAPMFDFGGHIVPIRVIPDDGVEAPSYITLGHGDRELITLFNGFDAIHTRHFTLNGQPAAQTTIGRCTSFY